MKIANADKLIHHFEHTVLVKNFTVPEIVTIIKSFSIEIPQGAMLVMPEKKSREMILENLKLFEKQKPGIDNKLLSEEQISEVIIDEREDF